MHERASPCPLVLGSGRKVSLSISADPPRPFYGVRRREMGLHIFVDADLGTPKARTADASIIVPPIASGRDPMVATADAKSVSVIRMYLGGVEFVNSSLRQHLTSPDPHTSEVGAAGTAITKALPSRVGRAGKAGQDATFCCWTYMIAPSEAFSSTQPSGSS